MQQYYVFHEKHWEQFQLNDDTNLVDVLRKWLQQKGVFAVGVEEDDGNLLLIQLAEDGAKCTDPECDHSGDAIYSVSHVPPDEWRPIVGLDIKH